MRLTSFLIALLLVGSNRVGVARHQPKPLGWAFPIARPHAGMLLGNGTQGLMVWGEGRQLNITIGRAGFWDHRGSTAFATKTTFTDVKRLLQAGDETGIKAAFAGPAKQDAGFGHPQQLGGGRLELTLPLGWKLTHGTLNLLTGEISVLATNTAGRPETLFIRQAVDTELAWISLPKSLANRTGQAGVTLKLVPAWDATADACRKAGIKAPTQWQTNRSQELGFTQFLPDDEPLTVVCQLRPPGIVTIATQVGANAQTVAKQTLTLSRVTAQNTAALFWRDYWSSVPTVTLPDPVLQEIVDYGLYKQACATPPQGIACALQGPFMEDYQLLPWSNDYHFNINIQMIYWPALATNRLSHFGPLWNMMQDWMPTLRQTGEAFFGQPGTPHKGALLLPHAVDDRGRVVGTFWAGTIDHACTAWMAQMAWQNYRYGLDQPNARTLLTEMAWPLLVGAFEGYYAMLEEVADTKPGAAPDAKRFSLPVSVSPEYGGSGMGAWGRDASFQLAALHRICRILPQAAKALGQPVDPRWADVDNRLPPYTTVSGIWLPENGQANERIALWEGKDLTGSHRHHSHLAGIYPFSTIDLTNPEQRKIVDNSLVVWRFRGAGFWTGWCVPWASTLLARTGQTQGAISWLHTWQTNFVNEGRGTLHNANNSGTSLIGSYDWGNHPQNREVMQLDAGFGALNAVLELLVQNHDDGLHILPNRSSTWRNLSFDNIRTEGAFQVGATVQEGRVSQVRVKSLAGEPLRIVLPSGPRYRLNGQLQPGNRIERNTKAGEQLTFVADPG